MKLLNNLRKVLNDDKVLYRIAFCGIFFALISVFSSIYYVVDLIRDEVRISIVQQENIICTPGYDEEGILRVICEVPDREYIREHLYDK